MATLQSLSIRGVRSYPSSPDTIFHFSQPLTIILGRNGSGKSSIIECIKFAITGTFPPTISSGAAFVHDPRIHNDTETRACIRLCYSTMAGTIYTIDRQMMLRIKRGGKPEFKRTAQSLKSVKDGEKKQKSSFRSADLDALVPESMGVSKAVLDNVIFVHQEESMWPLAESSKLKAKLDDIFAATRYSMALENIRKYRKEQNARLKQLDLELKYLEEKVKTLEEVRADVDRIKVENSALEKGERNLNIQIRKLEEEARVLRDRIKRFRDAKGELHRLKVECELLERDKKERYDDMKEHLPDMPLERLAEELDKLHVKLSTLDDRRSSAKMKRLTLQQDLLMYRQRLSKQVQRRGELKHVRRMYEAKVAQMAHIQQRVRADEAKWQPLTPSYKRQGVALPAAGDGNDAEAGVEEWGAALRALVADAREHVRETEEQCASTLNAANDTVAKYKLQHQSVVAQIENGEAAIKEMRERLREIRESVGENDGVKEELAEAERRLKALDGRVKELVESGEEKRWKREQADVRRHVDELKAKAGVLRREREQLAHEASEHARLDAAKDAARAQKRRLRGEVEDFAESAQQAVRLVWAGGEAGERREGEYEGMLQLVRDLAKCTDDNDNDDDDDDEELRKSVETVQTVSSRLQTRCEKSVSNAREAAQRAGSQLSAAKARLKDVQGRVQGAKKELREVSNETAAAAKRLADAAKEGDEHNQQCFLNRAQKEKEEGDAGIEGPVYEGYGELLDTSRALEGNKSSPRRVGELDVRRVRQHAETVEKKYGTARDRVMDMDTYVKVAKHELDVFEKDKKHRCPACLYGSERKTEAQRRGLKQRIERYKNPGVRERRKKEMERIESVNGVLKQLMGLVEAASGCSGRVTELEEEQDRLQEAVQRWEESHRACAEEEMKAEQGAGGEAVRDVREKAVEIRQIHASWERAEKEARVGRERVVVAGGKTAGEVEREMRGVLEEQEEQEGEVETIRRKVELAREERTAAEKRAAVGKLAVVELRPRVKEWERLGEERRAVSRRVGQREAEVEGWRREEKGLRERVGEGLGEVETVRAENEAVVGHGREIVEMRGGVEREWADGEREVERFESRGDEEERRVEEGIRSEEERIAETDKREREAGNAVQDVAEEEERVRERMGILKGNERYLKKTREVGRKWREVQTAEEWVRAILGEEEGGDGERVEEREREVQMRINGLKENAAATAARRQSYREQYSEKKRALDKLLSEGCQRRFDELRIERQTVQLSVGDLDKYHKALDQALGTYHTIKMSSINRSIKELWQRTYRGTDIDEIEIVSDTEASGGRQRSYSYRVCMRQGEGWLDMRGRCSAGQKVLACVVMRLALAECFCAQCGMLALDEPTAHLDRENVRSLAVGLREIVQRGREQRNFQLLLITHDQELIEGMGAREFAEEFVTVYKKDGLLSAAVTRNMSELA